MNKNIPKRVKTVIVGSGMSGISCAVRLLENNYDDWLMFEALDRIGGRCHTIEIDGTYLELGAQFIHGQQDNPIYNIAQKSKQVHDIFNEIILDDNSILDIESVLYVTQEGKKVEPKLASEMLTKTEELFQKAREYSFKIQRDENNTSDLNRSVAEYVYDKFCEDLQARNGTSSDMIRLSESFLIWRSKLENLLASTSSLLDLSIKNFCAYKELNGSQAVETKYGYKSILNKIIDSQRSKFEQRLCLKHMLKRVIICDASDKCAHCQYTTDSNLVVVLLNDSSDNEQVVLCENLVLTMSLGCLKANLDNIIQPNSLISEKKRLSINRVGYGVVNKIFLFYDKKFWPDHIEILRPLWLTNGESFLEKMKKSIEANWVESICEIDIKELKENESYCFLFWLHGCEFYDNFTNEKIINDLTGLLKTIFNRNDLPEPKSILKTSWHSNPLFRGSYSYFPVGSHYTDTHNLIEPISVNNKPVVMFAGEATHLEHFSTVHGAYLTGVREANRILDLNKVN